MTNEHTRKKKHAQPKKTWIFMLTTAFGLAGLVWWDEQQTRKDQETESNEKRLLDVDIDRVHTVALLRKNADSGEQELVFKKQGLVWNITKPVQERAEEGSVENLLNALQSYRYDQVVARNLKQRAQYGLEPPNREIRLSYTQPNQGSDQTWKLLVGGKAPVGYGIYSSTGQSAAVYIGSQYLDVATGKSLLDFRKKQPIDINPNSLTRFEYQRSATDIEPAFASVTQKVGEDFSLETYTLQGQNPSNRTKVASWPVDKDKFEDLLTALNSLEVLAFFDKPPREQTQAFERADITLKWSQGRQTMQTLKVTRANDRTYISFDPTNKIMQVEHESADSLYVAADEWRDKRMFRQAFQNFQRLRWNKESFGKVQSNWFEAKYLRSFDEFGEWEGEGDRPSEREEVRNMLVDLEFLDFKTSLSSHARKLLPAEPIHFIELSTRPALKQQTGSSTNTVLSVSFYQHPDLENHWLCTHSEDQKSVFEVEKRFMPDLRLSDKASATTKGKQSSKQDAAAG